LKKQRQAAIMKAVSGGRISSQAQLADILADQGFDASQTTISRDLRELGLGKLSRGGQTMYAGGQGQPLPAPDDAAFRRLAPQMLLSAEVTGNIVVLKTPIGNAQGLAAALDGAGFKGIAGTVAGDDTIFVVCSQGAGSNTMKKRLLSYTHGKVR
jgi:transcriptional regulator of arginine metabolism